MNEPAIYLITGIMASGKSTVAQLLAARFPRSVHLRGDLFRRMIVNDRQEVRPDAAEEELNQLRLRYRLAAQAAESYAQEGFTVIMQDVVVGRLLHDMIGFVRRRPFYVTVLCPRPDVAAAREAGRAKQGYGIWTVEALDEVLRKETPRVGLWLDSSDLTPEETADAILRRAADEAAIGG